MIEYSQVLKMLGNLLSGTYSSSAAEVVRRLEKIDLRFVVLGHRGTGKTTLLNRLAGLPIPTQHSPTVGKASLGPLEYECFGKRIRHKKPVDLGGDRIFWSQWQDQIANDRPSGIIFMVDHENPDKHVEALEFLVKVLSTKDKRLLFFKGPLAKARKQLRVVMILANKKDLWRKKDQFGRILRSLERPRYRLGAEGIHLVEMACSAQDGEGVDDALRQFFHRIL